MLFLNLDAQTLGRVLHAYGNVHGIGARRYAEAKYHKWREGSLEMSGMINERLLSLVPRFLPIDVKYDLIASIWQSAMPHASVSIDVTPDSAIVQVEQVLADHVNRLRTRTLPQSLTARLSWLSDGDGKAAQTLLREAMARQVLAYVEHLRAPVLALIRAFDHVGEKVAKARKIMTLPGIQIIINIRLASQGNNDRTGSKGMSEQTGGNSDQRDAQELVRRLNPGVPARAEDFVNDVFAQMSPKQAEELRHKAAQEAVRIQMKRAEGQVDQEMAADKIDEAVNATRRLESTSSSFTYRAEHKSDHGRVELEIKKDGRKPQARGCSTQLVLMFGPLLMLLYCLAR